ncbi:MAG: hypothetical protein HC899_32795 [Leptolyngbyaceae cyanobacterium SM1_4_3]|nr:hypothetical protein [Leptolyngbyaceae cyanobacterium SM1_4_3]
MQGLRQQPNSALVRTGQRRSVRVQGNLPPHNFIVGLLKFVGEGSV